MTAPVPVIEGPARQASSRRSLPALLLALSLCSFALAVTGAAACLRADLLLLFVCATAVAAATAGASVVTGALARAAAAVAIGSVIGTSALAVALVVHFYAGCVVIG